MLIEALNRTLLLMGTSLRSDCSLENRLSALVGTRVLVRADAAALATPSGQTALVTACMLMARSGHEIWLDVPLAGILVPQPPLTGSDLQSALLEFSRDLLPEQEFHAGRPSGSIDVEVVVGAPDGTVCGDQAVFLDAGDGWTTLCTEPVSWSGRSGPLGAMAAGALAAAEVFKHAMRKLVKYAPSPNHFLDAFAASSSCRIDLLPENIHLPTQLPDTDLISGGAIGNAAVYALARLPTLTGTISISDDDRNDLSNLNRNALLRRSRLGIRKVDDLARFRSNGIAFSPRPERYVAGLPLAKNVLLGVDHIPSRWTAQATMPDWLGVGATDGFSIQVSEHAPGQPCAGCLHPQAAPLGGPIPTVAFVSFWAGLLLVIRWLRHLSGTPELTQQTFFSPLRPEGWQYAAMGVCGNPDCPIGCYASAKSRNDLQVAASA